MKKKRKLERETRGVEGEGDMMMIMTITQLEKAATQEPCGNPTLGSASNSTLRLT